MRAAGWPISYVERLLTYKVGSLKFTAQNDLS